MNPDVYKGIWGGQNCRDSPIQANRICDCKDECEAGLNYVNQVQDVLNSSTPKV